MTCPCGIDRQECRKPHCPQCETISYKYANRKQKQLKTKIIPLREWLELGQVMNDKSNAIHRKYFKKHSVIVIGTGCKVKADGKTYRAGIYVLDIGA